MEYSNLFSLIIFNAISNKYLHIILILIEYCLLFLPSTLKSIRISMYIFTISPITPSDYYQTTTGFNPLNNYKQTLQSPLPLVLVIIAVVLLICYYIFHFFYLKFINSKDKAASSYSYVLLTKIIVNVFEIIFFRYFSFLLIDSIIYMIAESENKNSIEFTFLSVVLLGILSLYIYTIVKYIYTNALMFSIINKQISICFPKYLFSVSTIETDIYLLLIKLVIAFENNYGHIIVPFTLICLTSFMNVLALVLYILIPIKILISHYIYYFKSLEPWINIEINLIRYFLLVFNFLLALSFICFSKQSLYTTVLVDEYISYFFGSFIGALFIIFLIKHQMKRVLLNGDINVYKILYLLSQDIQEVSSSNNFISQVYSNMVSYHFYNCNNRCSFCHFHSGQRKSKTSTIRPYYCYTHSITYYLIKLFKLFKQKNNQTNNCSNSNTNNETSSNIENYTKLLNKVNKSDNVIFDLLQLLSYRIKKRICNYYSFYSSFKRKYFIKHPLILNNIELLNTCCFEETEGIKNDKVFFKEILSSSQVNQTIYEVLAPLKDYLSLSNKKNNSDQLVSLAAKMNQIRLRVLSVLTKAEKQDNPNQDVLKKTIYNALSYESTISQFIMETVFNESYTQIAPLDIDMLEEYLTHHYNNDRLLIMSVSFSQKLKEIIECKIIKLTGSIYNKDYKLLSDYFPNYIRQEGDDRLKKSLFHFKFLNKQKGNKVYAIADSDLESKGTFQFILQSSYYLEYFYYEYFLSPQLNFENYSVLLYGFYSKEFKNIMLLEQEDNGASKVLGYSRDVKDILCFRGKWLSILTNTRIKLDLNDVFASIKKNAIITTNITEANANVKTNTNSQSKPTNTDDTDVEYECLLSYMTYKTKIINYFNSLQELNEVKTNEKEMKSISKAIQTINDKIKVTEKYTLKRLFTITQNKSIFCLVKPQMETRLQSNEFIPNQPLPYSLMQYHTVNLSSSSMQERSLSKFTSRLVQFDEEKKRNKQQKECRAEKKKMKFYSLLTIILSLCLILSCLIFLIVEITITDKLQKITSLFIQFKTLKLSFSSIYMSFAFSLCYTSSKDEKECVNTLERLSLEFHNEHNLPQELSFEEFIIFELKNKTIFMQTLLIQVKNIMYNLNDFEIYALFLYKMNFSTLNAIKGNNQLQQIRSLVTFEEGLRTYLNSFAIIANDNYLDVPYYFITQGEGNHFTFENLNNQNRELDTIEMKIYEIVMNFLDIEYILSHHQTVVLNKFDYYRNQNINYLIIFMVIAFSFDLILDFLSRTNIIVGYQLFQEIIFQINDEINNPQTKAYIESKLNDLISLSCCYINNPNNIINKMRKRTIIYQAENLILHKPISQNNNSGTPLYTPDKTLLNIKPNRSAFRKINKSNDKIYNTITVRFLNLNFFFFLAYFVIIIILDIVLIINFEQLFKIFNYILWNCHLENWLYNDIVYSHMIFQVNTTESLFRSFVYGKNEGDDLINSFLKITFNYHKDITKYQSLSSSNYPSLGSYFDYNCEAIMKKINDPYFYQLEQNTNKSYTSFPVFICKHFNLLHLKNFEVIYRDLITRIQTLFYEYNGDRRYSNLAAFSNSKETLEIYIIELFFIKPVRRYYTLYILTPLIQFEFKKYMIFVIIYLVVNSLLECVIFLVIKWLIVDKLNTIQDNLFLLKKCF